MTAQSDRIEAASDTSGSSEAPGSVVLEGVTKRFGAQTAVDNLSLTIQPGEFISLLGPSGCGKTTTLRMIAGFEHPDGGAIRISGVDVLGTPPHKRDVNTVFQAYALFPHMSVAENVAYGLQQRRTPKAEVRERVAAALDLVQMREYADRKPTQLSGGQQQRVALARALVNRPAVLLLDEPLGALDRKLREEMQLELKLIQSQLGITFVFVTHDQAEALAMSDRVAVMRDGRIEQLDDPDTIYARPASAYVAAFVGQQNFFDGTVSSDGTGVESPQVNLRGGGGVESPAPGERARASVRPEYVDLAAALPTDADIDPRHNAVQGEVLGISHLGETTQFLVQVDGDLSLISRRPTPEAPQVTVGDRVWCWWRPASVQIFPDGDLARRAGHVDPPTTETVRAGSA